MRLTITPTEAFQHVEGQPLRCWEGKDDNDTPVHVWVRFLSPQTHDPERLSAFDAASKELPQLVPAEIVVHHAFEGPVETLVRPSVEVSPEVARMVALAARGKSRIKAWGKGMRCRALTDVTTDEIMAMAEFCDLLLEDHPDPFGKGEPDISDIIKPQSETAA